MTVKVTPKEFELTLVWREMHNPDPKAFGYAKDIHKIEADDLVQLMTQFVLVIANVQRRLSDDKIQRAISGTRLVDDDIPF